MGEIIFCRTRHTYDSYRDFWRLVSLCRYPVIYVDEIPDAGVKDNVYIVTPLNGEWQSGIKTDARVVLWDLEWRGGLAVVPGVTEVWSADRFYANKIGARHVPLGSHPQLVPDRDWANPPAFDVAMLAYMTHRRQLIGDGLTERGLRRAPNAWGQERDFILRRSRALMHVHQLDGVPTLAPQRFALAAASAAFLISETVADPWPFEAGRDFYALDYPDLVSGTVGVLANGAGRDMAANLWHKGCEAYRFDKVIANAL